MCRTNPGPRGHPGRVAAPRGSFIMAGSEQRAPTRAGDTAAARRCQTRSNTRLARRSPDTDSSAFVERSSVWTRTEDRCLPLGRSISRWGATGSFLCRKQRRYCLCFTQNTAGPAGRLRPSVPDRAPKRSSSAGVSARRGVRAASRQSDPPRGLGLRAAGDPDPRATILTRRARRGETVRDLRDRTTRRGAYLPARISSAARLPLRIEWSMLKYCHSPKRPTLQIPCVFSQSRISVTFFACSRS